jgi:peptide chain release factor 3
LSIERLQEEIRRRKTFAIISHPDAGKTTLTEKLLLYGGAIHLAGSVKARRAAHHATSDWMAMEQERGISVTSSVMQFPYRGYQINLLDTPGHKDFSEDTYRTLTAADSAVMLLDNARGVEDRTRKLFEVAKLRGMPIFTFVNKCDRSGQEPLALLDEVERELGIASYPITWPIGMGPTFRGIYHRLTRQIHLFERGTDHGQHRATVQVADLEDDSVRELLGAELHDQLLEDIELLDMVGDSFDAERFRRGELSPGFFGSAMTNFGVEPFLDAFLELAPGPAPRETTEGMVVPEDPDFSGFVFKIQANMDPKHRDRIAFLRVCSGRFEAGMQARHSRSGRTIRLAGPQQFLAQERTAVEEAWPGDIVGLHDRGTLRIGDTLSAGTEREFVGMPIFSPEHFARVVVPDPLKRKHLSKGLEQLAEEGAVQVYYSRALGGVDPIVGAVGQLQFDVLLHRLEHEYGVKARLEGLGYRLARWVEHRVGGAVDVAALANAPGRALVEDVKGRELLLFESEWSLRTLVDRHPEFEFLVTLPG